MKEAAPRTIKWGIIGLGKIANKFASDLLKTKGSKLYAVASRDQEKANSFASQYNAYLAFDNYEDLVKLSAIDAIYIATPHTLHKQHTILALQHKKAVLCEKPFAMNLEEVEEMIAVAKANNVLLMEALWTYFLPQYQFVLQELQRERFGKITKLEADFGFEAYPDMMARVFRKELGGGSLLDIGIYPIFVALSTLGKPVDIDAKATFLDNGVDATCNVIFNYNNGVKAFLNSSLIEKTATEAIFHCERGIIKINTRFHEPSTVTLYYDDMEDVVDFKIPLKGYNYEITHFAELILEGKTESPLMTHHFSRTLMEILDDVRKLIGLNYSKL